MWRRAKTRERNSATEQPAGDESLDDDVDEFFRNDDDFDNLVTVKMLGHFFIGLGKPADFVLGDVNGHPNPAAQLAVDLDGKFKLLFSGKIGGVSGPRHTQGRPGMAQFLPEFIRADALRLDDEALLEANLYFANVLPVLQRVSLQCQKAGLVSFFKCADLARGEDRLWRTLAPHPQKSQVIEDAQSAQVFHFLS
jgi:hypothetical protein